MATQCNVTVFLSHCAISAPRGMQDPPTPEAMAPPTLMTEHADIFGKFLEPQLIVVLSHHVILYGGGGCP